MILVALGSNMPGPWGSPRDNVVTAVKLLGQGPTKLRAASSLIVTQAYGKTNQPDFVNAVVELQTALSPLALLRRLHMIERLGGRRRRTHWGPRTIDLDLIDYHGLIKGNAAHQTYRLVLPHPGTELRDFVLAPIMEIAPHWHHPISRQTAAQSLRRLSR